MPISELAGSVTIDKRKAGAKRLFWKKQKGKNNIEYE